MRRIRACDLTTFIRMKSQPKTARNRATPATVCCYSASEKIAAKGHLVAEILSHVIFVWYQSVLPRTAVEKGEA